MEDNFKDSYSPNEDTWKVWARYVLLTLEKLQEDVSNNNKLIQELMIELKVLQTKTNIRSIFIGAISGFLPALGILIYFLIKTS